jgi:hypothetical protein
MHLGGAAGYCWAVVVGSTQRVGAAAHCGKRQQGAGQLLAPLLLPARVPNFVTPFQYLGTGVRGWYFQDVDQNKGHGRGRCFCSPGPWRGGAGGHPL